MSTLMIDNDLALFIVIMTRHFIFDRLIKGHWVVLYLKESKNQKG